MGKKEELIFTTEEEKEDYIEYINNKYGDRIDVLKETKKIIRDMNFREKENYNLMDAIMTVGGFAMLLIFGPFLIVGALDTAVLHEASVAASKEIPTWFWWAFGAGALELLPIGFFPKYKGLHATLLSIIKAPFILLSVLGDGINKNKSYEKKMAIAKKAKVVPLTDEEKKNLEKDKDRSVDQYISDFMMIDKSNIDRKYLDAITARIKCVRDGIKQLKDEEKIKSYMNQLLNICNSFDKTSKLSGERKDTFNKYIIEQLDNLNSFVVYDYSHVEDPEVKRKREELISKINFKPYFSSRGINEQIVFELENGSKNVYKK